VQTGYTVRPLQLLSL